MLLSNQIFLRSYGFLSDQTGVEKMFHTRLGISKEHMLDGLFQKVSCVGLL